MAGRWIFILVLAWLLAGCGRGNDGVVEAPTNTAIGGTPAALGEAAGPASVAPATTPATVGPATPAASVTPIPTATSSPLPTATPTPNYPVYQGRPLPRDDFGVQIHLHREDQSAIMDHLRALDVGWVKVQVSWKLFEPQPGDYDAFLFEELDRIVATAGENDIKVMLGVAKAPEWSRPTTELDGPPSDYAQFRDFMAALATRYSGRVAAYELWNEANLQREWNGAPLSAAGLVDLIRAGAGGVRSADLAAVLISGAPATTGINDGVTAVDDRIYLEQMIAAGVAEVVDAVGAHPYGWANPPGSSSADPDPAAASHNNHPSFFFKDTLYDYRRILDQAGFPSMPIWVTEFGWGSYDGFGVSPPEEVSYMAAVDEQQQAIYIQQAYVLAGEWGWVGPMILWNLNFAPTFGPDFTISAYSLLRPDGSPRPAYYAIASVPKLPER